MSNKLLNEMRGILNKYDPIGIYSGNNFDEYDPEIREIYKISKNCKNLEKFIVRVHKIFIHFFDKRIAGSKQKYVKVSKDLFKLLNRKKRFWNT